MRNLTDKNVDGPLFGCDPMIEDIMRAFNMPDHVQSFVIRCDGPDSLLEVECTYTPYRKDAVKNKITQKFNLVLAQD